MKKSIDYTRGRKKWVFLLAALGFSGYGVYSIYQLPSVAVKRKRLFKLFRALISIAEAISDTTQTIGVLSKDFKEFLQSDSDQIPNSINQISKITRSEVFSDSVIRVTQGLTAGILRGYRSEKVKIDDELLGNSSFPDKVMDKLFTTAGSGFASVVVGSFARNLVMALYSAAGSNLNNSTTEDSSIPRWVKVVCDDKCKELVCECIQLFVSTAVAVYLDKTLKINTYDEVFSGLTNPKHETKVRNILGSVCNGAIETLVKTSHQVLTISDDSNNSSSISFLATNGHLGLEALLPTRKSFHENKDRGWISKMSSTLAVPSNRRFVLEMTGRVTFETVRSFLEFLLEKLSEGLKQRVNVVHEEVIDMGLEVVRFVTAKSSVIATICLSLCLHVLDGAWVLVSLS